ncbi:hypothetical protein CLV59_101875 [Chitinophaga dinghuensis]|uniref:Uncharacterized protein n=1 Tax=Chitinophaga dinghuensis TaxID=1539050 RepID=A0A327WFI1_9BACT|nr:hypothetical protein [Chitinophaga dinghuensis]RAJ88110.1 hypothetical protein CLV59_101875 [Chitinophaga dinghuensis]
MEILALTCPQCGSADVKLLPERSDMAQCNRCGALIFIPAAPMGDTKPKITEVQQEQELEVEEEEVVYPVKPTPPPMPIGSYILPGGMLIVGLIGILVSSTGGTSAPQSVAVWGILLLIGVVALVRVYKNEGEKQEEYENSEEMQTYIRERDAAVAKSWAQMEERERQKK